MCCDVKAVVGFKPFLRGKKDNSIFRTGAARPGLYIQFPTPWCGILYL